MWLELNSYSYNTRQLRFKIIWKQLNRRWQVEDKRERGERERERERERGREKEREIGGEKERERGGGREKKKMAVEVGVLKLICIWGQEGI